MYTEKIERYLSENSIILDDIVKLLDDKRFMVYDMKDLDNFLYENSPTDIIKLVNRSDNFDITDDLFVYDTVDNVLISYSTKMEYLDYLTYLIDEIAIEINERILNINPMLLDIIKEVVK